MAVHGHGKVERWLLRRDAVRGNLRPLRQICAAAPCRNCAARYFVEKRSMQPAQVAKLKRKRRRAFPVFTGIPQQESLIERNYGLNGLEQARIWILAASGIEQHLECTQGQVGNFSHGQVSLRVRNPLWPPAQNGCSPRRKLPRRLPKLRSGLGQTS